jgi:hypothetical protein
MQIAKTEITTNKQLLYYGKEWADGVQINIKGSVRVDEGKIEDVYTLPPLLLADYKRGFGSYNIRGHEIETAIVKNVNISNSGPGKYDFSVDFEGYNFTANGVFGILDPVNEWTVAQQDDGQVQLTHTISARGLTATGLANPTDVKTALKRASGFVAGLIGFVGYNSGLLKDDLGVNPPCLVSSGTMANEMNGLYQVTEQYILDPDSPNPGVVRYNVTCQSSMETILTATVNGEIHGCSEANANELYAAFDFAGAVMGCLSGCVDAGGENLNWPGKNNQRVSWYNDWWNGSSWGTFPPATETSLTLLSKNRSADSAGRKITFSAVYNTDKDGVFVDTTIKTAKGVFTTVDVGGTIRARGDIANRWNEVEVSYGGEEMAFGMIPAGSSQFPFNPDPLSFSNTFNEYGGEITFSATYNDRELPPEGFIKFNYSISINPPLKKYSAEPQLFKQGQYHITDLGYVERGTVSIQGQGITRKGILPSSMESFCLGLAEDKCLQSVGKTEDYRKESESTSIDDNSRKISFQQSWSYEGAAFGP